jgi:hypothetical protein
MKTLNEIREERQANAAKVAELNDKIEKAVNSWRKKEPFPEDFETLGAELVTAKKIGLILRNNYNNRLAADVLPALVEILKKYNGKKYGEKTKEKMGEEFKAMTGCGLYLEKYAFSQECYNSHVYEMRDGYKRGEEVEFGTHPNFIINDANIIQAQPADAFKVYDFGEYIEAPAERVEKLAEKKKELDEMRAAFNKAVDAYNALTVNGIDYEKRA